MAGSLEGETYMSLRVVQALVKVLEHVGKFICTDEVGSTRSIKPAGHGLEIGVVLEVVIHVVGQVIVCSSTALKESDREDKMASASLLVVTVAGIQEVVLESIVPSREVEVGPQDMIGLGG
ncbi:hypothetical protein KCU81_g780, partial [Aureobasidium melanogenum]